MAITLGGYRAGFVNINAVTKIRKFETEKPKITLILSPGSRSKDMKSYERMYLSQVTLNFICQYVTIVFYLFTFRDPPQHELLEEPWGEEIL